MGAYKGHFRIICTVCERLIQPGKEGSETIVGVCDDCRTLSDIEAKRHQVASVHIDAIQMAAEAGRSGR